MRKLTAPHLTALVGLWLLASASAAPAADSAHLARARETALTDPVAAEALYRESLASLAAADPARVEASIELSELLDRQGDFTGALEVLSSLPSPLPPRGRVLKAAALEGAGRSLDALREWLALQPSLDDVEAEEASARVRALMEGMSEKDLLAISEKDPASPEGMHASLLLARLRIAAGRGKEAEPLLERLLALAPEEPLSGSAETLLARARAARASKPGFVGLALPLTGPLAPFGKSALRGALLASALLRHGVDAAGGPSLTLLIADTHSTPEGTERALVELAAQGAVGILGPMKGDAAKSAAEAARSVGIPLVTLTPARDHVGGDVFRLFLREEEEMDGLVRFAVETRGMRRFALLVPDTDAGRRYRALFWDAAVRHGAEIVASESFAPAETNLEIPLKRMTGIHGLTEAERRERFDVEREEALARLAEKGEGPDGTPRELPERLQSFAKFKPRPIVDFDGLFLPVSGMTAAQLAPQLPYNDITGVTLLGSRSWNYESFVKVGEQYVENALFPAEWHESTPEGGAFAEAFVSAYADPPGTMEAYAFDAVRLFAAALAAGQADERAAVARFLSRLAAVPAVTGPLSSLPGGDIAVEPKILTASHRRIVAATPLSPNGVKETP